LIVKWHNKTTKTIGIKSQGDPGCELKERLQEIVDDYSVDYLFCATRTKGETVNDVYEVSKLNGYEILWTSTYQSDKNENESLIDFLNKLKAKHLLDLLKELIKEDERVANEAV